MVKKKKKEQQEEAFINKDEQEQELLVQEQAEAEKEAPGTADNEVKQEDPDPLQLTQQELDEWKDKYLRLSAEFDNFRKRTLKEKIEMSKVAGKDIMSDFLPVMDDFERAMAAMQKTDDIESVKEGLTLIFSKCLTFLKSNKVQEIEAVNKPFDTELHDAVTKIPAPDEKQKGLVIDVIQKGYMIDDKVLRYAKVVIGD